MEFAQIELEAVEVAIAKNTTAVTRELKSLELALVGGGMGDVVFA